MKLKRILWDDLIPSNQEEIVQSRKDLSKHQYHKKLEFDFMLNVLSALKDIDDRLNEK